MGTCGTDLIHHLDFLNKAEIYRRYFVKKLNDEYTVVSTVGENAYLSDNKFFKSISDFNYSSLNFYQLVIIICLTLYFFLIGHYF